ncbi:hypothetical protein P879_06889 [Paragonimus westermani]|uniref:PEP5/VPS11 N-terminal domain-containing protein n=1 Tax=Paragonimus westermani TaxID=34504 RepID=A0A8T0DND1_9TREM|nr:hypothetical protein P879_06889 [Paragonimus westermani]
MAYSRRLFFFDKISARDGQQSDLFTGFSDVQPTCTSSGRGFLWIGDASGFIYRLDRGQQLSPFKAFTQAVRHVYQLKQQDLLLTIGVDEFNDERMKIWNTAKWANKPTPYCSRSTTTAVPGQTESPVSCLCVDETLQLIVFGHTNGQLQLLRGDITRERHCKRHLLHTFASPVTGLGIHLFCSNYPGVHQAIQSESIVPRGDPQGPVIFATTDQCIMSFILNKRDEVLCKTVLDRFGASANCSSMFPVASDVAQFAVACRDAVYFYNWDGRGPCLATDGNKLALSVFKQYLVILKGDPGLFLSPVGNMPRSHSATNVPNHTARSSNPTTVVIHDQQNKFITGEFTVYGVRSMFTEWDGIYLLCSDTSSEGQVKYTLTCLNEKTTQAKLDMLFERKNFQLAIDIAKSQNLGQEELARIFWRYADHLYKYVLDVQSLHYFLEGGHIVQLAYYLEALDSAGLASSDHLVLLLNCYARLQDKERITQFVQGPVRSQLNVSTAIQVLRQASYPQAALKLAETCGRFVDQVGILIEDLNDCAGALAVIERFPFDEALKAVCAHGHWLMDRLPTETVQLLDQLCSRPGTSQINVHHFLRIFINNRDGLMQFLERYVKTAGKSIKVAGVVDALLELVLYEANRLDKASDGAAKSTVRSPSRERLLKLALSLLRDEQLLYDSKKALLVCHQRGFFDGCIYLWEKERLYDQLLKHYMSLDDTANVLLTCTRFGTEMPDLWLLALRYFASKPDCADALHQVVSEVDQRNLASPMAVLHILSDTDAEHSCQLGTIRVSLSWYCTFLTRFWCAIIPRSFSSNAPDWLFAVHQVGFVHSVQFPIFLTTGLARYPRF